jgi:hypothetical protein
MFGSLQFFKIVWLEKVVGHDVGLRGRFAQGAGRAHDAWIARVPAGIAVPCPAPHAGHICTPAMYVAVVVCCMSPLRRVCTATQWPGCPLQLSW